MMILYNYSLWVFGDFFIAHIFKTHLKRFVTFLSFVGSNFPRFFLNHTEPRSTVHGPLGFGGLMDGNQGVTNTSSSKLMRRCWQDRPKKSGLLVVEITRKGQRTTDNGLRPWGCNVGFHWDPSWITLNLGETKHLNSWTTGTFST